MGKYGSYSFIYTKSQELYISKYDSDTVFVYTADYPYSGGVPAFKGIYTEP